MFDSLLASYLLNNLFIGPLYHSLIGGHQTDDQKQGRIVSRHLGGFKGQSRWNSNYSTDVTNIKMAPLTVIFGAFNACINCRLIDDQI